jgi:hypothetical protein
MRIVARCETLRPCIPAKSIVHTQSSGRFERRPDAMTSIALPAAATVAWLVTPFLILCVVGGWVGLVWLAWRATSHHTGPGEAAFMLCGLLDGLTIWSRSFDDNGPGHDPPADEDGHQPEWDWDRFGRDLADYEASIRPPVRARRDGPRS